MSSDSFGPARVLADEYVRYARGRNGLGNVLGGLAGLAIFLVNGLGGPGMWTALLTIGLVIIWLAGKAIIRRRLYYRPAGLASKVEAPALPTVHRLLVILLLLLAADLWAIFLAQGAGPERQLWPYLAFYSVMPWLARRYLRTVGEYVGGVFLLLACAITAVGGGHELWRNLQMPVFAAALIGVGLAEHRQLQRQARLLRLLLGDGA